MNEQRISYPRLAGALVESINALLSAGELSVPIDGGAVVAIGPAQAPEAFDSGLDLEVAVGGSPVRIGLNRGAVDEALGGLMPAPAFAALDDDLKLAVLETTLAGPRGALRTLLGADIVLRNLDSGPAEAGGSSSEAPEAGGEALNGLLFEVRVPADVVRCRVLVELLAPLPDSVLAQLASSTGFRAHDFGGLPVPVTIELGEASLSASEAGSLEAGDVVLFDRCYVLDGRMRVNLGGRRFLAGRLEGLTLTVENSPG